MDIGLAVLVICGLSGAWFFTRLKLPGLVGMLMMGIVAGPYLLGLLNPKLLGVSGEFRRIALIVILLRAGFELRRDMLHRVGKPALLMSCIPALFEIAAVWFVAPRLLNISPLEAAILGSILAAVSPAVVVPLMIDFMDRGKGAKKGIPTLILAASSVDDVFVIVIFTILLGMYGGEHVNLWIKIGSIPVSIILGILIGLAAGLFLFKLFKRFDWATPKKTLMVMSVAILLTWVEEELKQWVPMAGLLGVMAIGFIVLEKDEGLAHIISQKLKKIWVFAEILLFVLVGAQVNIFVAWDSGLAGAAVILTGLIFRSIGTYLSLMGSGLTFTERIFCIVAYIPKATVQAAIGAVPLACGVASGEVILAVAVLSILLTAPLGAVGIKVMGERILKGYEYSAYRFKDIRERLALPRTGDRVRSKRYGTIWKIIQEKEEWLQPAKNGSLPIPVIYLRFWKVDNENKAPGTGRTLKYRYSLVDESFDRHWELVHTT